MASRPPARLAVSGQRFTSAPPTQHGHPNPTSSSSVFLLPHPGFRTPVRNQSARPWAPCAAPDAQTLWRAE